MIWVRTLTLVFAIGVLRAADPVTPVNQNGQGIAVKGTDVVAYFTGGSPKTGQAGLSHRWMGATWLFSSRENLDALSGEPGKVCTAIWRLLRLCCEHREDREHFA